MKPVELPPGIEAAGVALRAREFSAVELTSAFLDRIDATDGDVNAFISVTHESALAAARMADEELADGRPRGPLHGIPISIKDNIDTAGLRTTCGSSFLAENVPSADATVVSLLKDAGAVVLGKTNMHEFAWGGTTENEHFGSTRNPWDLSRNAHGSSGGAAAAVAAGQCLASIGTDTGGSVRNPAAVTGVTGLRPTVGRVSCSGVFPVAWTMDTVGPITRSAREAAIVLEAIIGPGATCASGPGFTSDASVGSLTGKRIGIVRDFALGNVDAGVRHCVENALVDLEAAGAELVELQMPDLDDYYSAWLIIHNVEPSSAHRQFLARYRDEYGVDVRGSLLAGQAVPAADYVLAMRYRRHLQRQFRSTFDQIDAMITPTSATTASMLGEDPRQTARRRTGIHRPATFFTGLPSTLGVPAISVPCGFSDGLPVGMQIMGRPFDEHGVLQIASAYQELTDWHQATADL